MWPSRQKQPAETRTPKPKAEGNKRPCFTPAGGGCVLARVCVGCLCIVDYTHCCCQGVAA
jgi:hypothetical protein